MSAPALCIVSRGKWNKNLNSVRQLWDALFAL